MSPASFLEKLKKPLAPGGIIILVAAVIYFKFLLFDLIWALDTTLSGFQFPQGWLTKLILSVLLTLPLVAIRKKWYVALICVVLDLWLIANLMYFRSYYTVIPFSSYLLAGNLADFQASVWESLRWCDIVFPMTTIALLWKLWSAKMSAIATSVRPIMRRILVTLGATSLVLAVYLIFKGGYKKAYEDLLYDYSTCGAAVYTIPGTWIYELIKDRAEMTPEIKNQIESWLNERPSNNAPSLPDTIVARDNCIIILAESLESWPLETTVDGIELTPNLNRYLRESNVLYAPNMLTQVKGSRSIDAQLFIHTGLMPVNYGSFAYRFPHNTYMTLDKAFKEKHDDGKSFSFTVDKKVVWNVAIVAQDFGYDRLLDKPFFTLDVKSGPRHRLADHSFLRQSAEKIETEELFKTGGHTLLQCVTYSGHTPFVIPDELKTIHMPGKYPERLRNYMEVANYTDRAIGDFIERIRSNPKFDNTMIVITGDHEGIGIARKDYMKDPDIARFLSPGTFTPFIVLNSPVTMRYDGVFGQVDMYPTLLDLLRLDSYQWRGLGQSLLDTRRKPFAISPLNEIVGDTTGVTQSELQHARDAYDISDIIISADYFKSEIAD